jgi:hypothetical protein
LPPFSPFLLPRFITSGSNRIHSIIYGYFEMAAKEGDLAGMKGMIMG